jgi:hypothetical protein
MEQPLPIPIPVYLKRRPRCNSYPSPPEIKIIARIKRPLLPPKKSEQSNSCPVPKNHKEKASDEEIHGLFKRSGL